MHRWQLPKEGNPCELGRWLLADDQWHSCSGQRAGRLALISKIWVSKCSHFVYSPNQFIIWNDPENFSRQSGRAVSTEKTTSLETRRHQNGHSKWGLAGPLFWLLHRFISRSQMGEDKQAEHMVLDCEKLCMPDIWLSSWKQRELLKVLEHRSVMRHLQLRKINAEDKALASPARLNS